MNDPSPPQPPPIVTWWVIWFALIVGVTVAYNVIQPPTSQSTNETLRYLPIMPLLLSAVVRWFILPRLKHAGQAFAMFIVGMALAEGCAILGLVLVPDMKATYLCLGLLGIAQFAPLFATRYQA